MNPIDLAFAAVLGYGIYKGIKGGFVNAIWMLVQVTGALIVALRFSYIASSIFERMFNVSGVYTPLMAFVFVFLLAMGTFYVIGEGLTLFMKAAHVSTMSRTVGILIWSILLTIGFSFGLQLSDGANMLTRSVKENSKVYAYIEPMASVLLCKLDFVGPSASKVAESIGQITKVAIDKAVGECGNGSTVTTTTNNTTASDSLSRSNKP